MKHIHTMDVLGLQFCREVYSMFYEQSYTIAQIAEEMNYSQSDVRDGIDAYEYWEVTT